MAKSFYQRKGDYRLPKTTYQFLYYYPRRYPEFIETIERVENKNPLIITDDDILSKITAEKGRDMLERCIDLYVEVPLQEAVKAHGWHGTEYIDLEDKYHYSVSTMKRAYQKYIWGLAQELGEDLSERKDVRKGRIKRGKRR